MPFSNRSLARPAGGAVVRRGGNESPRLNLHGVTGVEGTERRELGVDTQLREGMGGGEGQKEEQTVMKVKKKREEGKKYKNKRIKRSRIKETTNTVKMTE